MVQPSIVCNLSLGLLVGDCFMYIETCTQREKAKMVCALLIHLFYFISPPFEIQGVRVKPLYDIVCKAEYTANVFLCLSPFQKQSFLCRIFLSLLSILLIYNSGIRAWEFTIQSFGDCSRNVGDWSRLVVTSTCYWASPASSTLKKRACLFTGISPG